MSEWIETTLGEISSNVSYGYTESANEEKVGPKFLRITDIQGGVVNWEEVPYCPISEKDLEKYRLKKNDIVVARTGNSTGENYLFDSNEIAVYASYLIKFSLKKSVFPKYVWYTMRSNNWWKFIEGNKTGSAQAGANAKTLSNYPFNLPPLPEQKAIAHILGTLDDKIELNRQMNQTLEAMAQALFKSWFVDFDPVMDNALASNQEIPDELQAMAEKRRVIANRTVIASGNVIASDEGARQSHLDVIASAAKQSQSHRLIDTNPKLAAKFPSSFVFNETLGKWIPEGWEVKSLYDSAEFINGASFKSEYFSDKENGKPIIKIVELKNGITDQTKFTTQQMPAKYSITKGDLLYSWSGSPDTSLSAFLWAGGDGWLNQHVFNVVTLNENHKAFCFSLLNELKSTLIAIAKDKQTTGLGHVTVKDMKNLHVVHPTSAFEDLVDKSIGPIFKKVFQLQLETITLTQLRDTLLPVLISGKVRVCETDELIEQDLDIVAERKGEYSLKSTPPKI